MVSSASAAGGPRPTWKPSLFPSANGGGGSGLMNAGTNPHGNSENIPEDGQADQVLWRVSDRKSSAFPHGKLHW